MLEQECNIWTYNIIKEKHAIARGEETRQDQSEIKKKKVQIQMQFKFKQKQNLKQM